MAEADMTGARHVAESGIQDPVELAIVFLPRT
jgi:hypothetical protein